MGNGFSWRCSGCNTKKTFMTGRSKRSYDSPKIREEIMAGKHGAIAQAALAPDFPVKVNTIDSRAYFACPSCGSLELGKVIKLSAGDGADFILNAPPKTCSKCKASFATPDECVALEGEPLRLYLEDLLRPGCPKCGGYGITIEPITWD